MIPMPSTKIRRSAIALSATILLVVACASGAIFFGVLSSITDRDRDASSSSSLEALLDHRNPPTSPHHPQVPHRRMDQLVDDFVPLSCNANLATAVCVPWSRRFGVESVIDKRIVIPCGECVVMDHVSPAIAAATTEDHAQGPPEETDREDNRLTLTLGMDIRGKLVFPDDYSLTLHTALIAVQGQLHISTASTQAPVNGNPSIRIVLTGQDDQFFVPVGENKNVCDKGALCNAGKKGLIVAGGQVDIRGLPDNTPTWVRLHDAIHKNGEDLQFPSVIVVDAAVKNGWAAGAEILITSHTRDWDGHQVRKIVAVSDYTRRLVQIELDAPIRRPTTLLQSEDFAVEVALLSRNIVIEGGPDSKKFHGGHFWFMNTPSIVQSLVGVDFRNMGQQGTLGRYPIHLHMGSDMTGSTISKNTIRQSNQRCIVVHNTHNLLVEENIAYDTKGHCFIVEDGMETGNKFLRNLGAQTGAPDEVIPDWGPNGIETDDDPATFWITNPSNYWIGNVAAGSQGAGFWFELQLRGTHKHLFSHVDPKTAPLLKFENNVAHSNNNKGFRTYPSGYLPEQVQTLGGLKSYRNDGAGLFLHITKNIVVERSIFADNRNIGIDIDRADGISVLNSQVIGLSDSFRDLLSDQDARPSCVEDAQYGIEFHTWKHDPANVGTTIRNVTISNFINVSCPIATPFHVDNTIKTGQFNMFTTFSNLKLQDPRSAIDFCDAEYAGIIDIYLNDLDGSFRPLAASSDESASLVSNNLGMLQFVNRFRCNTNEAKCYSYCTNTCFRTVRFEIDPANTADYRLRVCRRNEPSNCIYVVGQQRVEDEYDHSFEPRVFLAHLPEGTYDAAILGSRGSETWPSFVEVHYEVSNCADAVDDFVRLIEPPTLVNECNALIQNGNFERSESDPIYWTYRIGGMKLVPGSGVGGSNAVAGIERSALTTFSQFLDTRCLKLQKGRFYEVTADIKLENSNGSVFVCDSTKTSCPGIGLFTPNDYRPLAGVDPELTPRGFQSIQTIVAIDDKLASSALARFDIKSNVDDKLLVVDNVSMRLVVDESSYCDNVILTSTVERERYWAVADGGELSIVPGPLDANPSTATRQAIRIGSRRGFDDGLFYKGWRPIELACLKPGSRWRIAAQLQLAQRGTVKGVSCEGARDCPSVRVTVKDKAGNQVFAEKFQTSIPNANTFNLFKTNFTLPSDKTWDGTIGNAVVDIRFFPVEYDLIVGAFSMSYIG